MTRAERWWTCTPKDFEGDAGFFSRDSGLLCSGFRQLGMDSRVVMLGESRNTDGAPVIRASMRQMRSSSWWSSCCIDGVVLYAWGRPEFTPIARAIREAGIRLILSQDSGGFVSPFCGAKAWFLERWMMGKRWGALRVPVVGLQLLRSLTWGIVTLDLRRLDHFSLGDGISAVSPGALVRYRHYVHVFGRSDLEPKLFLLPHPVSQDCCFEIGLDRKGYQVVAVGRWIDSAQKRTDLLLQVFESACERWNNYRFIIVGQKTASMDRWYLSLPSRLRDRVEITGPLAHEQLVKVLKSSRILFVPSAFESFHITAGEALCCGATIVGSRGDSLPSLRWFVRGGGGTLAAELNTEALKEALFHEIGCWDAGSRSPTLISKRWMLRLHADKVAAKVVAWSRELSIGRNTN